MTAFVSDASATLPWCFADEATTWTEALLDRLRNGGEAFVPAHWPVEVMNGLVAAERKGRIGFDLVLRFARNLEALPIHIALPHAPAAWKGIIELANKHRLTSYDAAYLELAQKRGLPLAILDEALRRAARAEHTALVETAITS